MKKRIVIFTAIAAMVYIGTTSYHGGAGAEGSLNRTGAKGSMPTCGGAGCHTGVSPAATAKIYIDSAGGVPVTKYTAGKTYTIKVVGKHATNDEYGFQFAAVSGTGSAQVQAGTFGTTLPANVIKTTLSGLDLIEHSDHLAAVSGVDSFITSFSWTAPTASVGNVTLYLSVNAINGNHMADANDYTANTSVIVPAYPATTSVTVVKPIVQVSVYPNPVYNDMNITLTGGVGTYNLKVMDIMGRTLLSGNIEAAAITSSNTINTSNWAPGLYTVVIENEQSNHAVQVLKK